MKNFTKTILASFILLFVLSNSGWGQTNFSATYTFGSTGNVQSFSYNGTTYSGITPGTIDKIGVTTSSSSGNFRATTWPTASSIDLGKYIQFSIAPVAGYKYTITSITFGVGRSGTGTTLWQWRGSFDSYGAAIDNYTTLNSGLTNSSGVLTNPDANSSWTGNVLNVAANYSDLTGTSTFRLYSYGAEASSGTAGLQGPITIEGTYQPTSPMITTTGTLTAFSTVAGTPSTEQTYTVSGSNLTADISITAPTNFQISTNSGTGFSSGLTLTQSGGTVSSTTIYVRYNPSAGGSHSGDITHSSTGATTVNVAVSGTSLDAEPTTQSSNVVFSNQGINTITVGWSSGNGAGRIAFMKQANSGTTAPVDGSTYTANTVFGSGSPLGSGWYCIYNGTGNTVDVSGLTANTDYVVMVFEFNGSGATINYNTNTGTNNPNYGTTKPASDPTITVSGSLSSFGVVAVGSVSAEQSYTVSGSTLIDDIVINAPTGFEISLTSGSEFASSLNLTPESGTVNATTIYVRFAPLSTGSFSGNITHSSTNATQQDVAVSGTAISAEPTTQAGSVNFTAVQPNQFTINWTNGNGSNRLVLVKSGSAVDGTPADQTSYTADAVFGNGTMIGTGNYTVYNGTGSSVTVTGLSSNTTYHVAIFEFNGSGTTVNYLTTTPATGSQTTTMPPAATYTWNGATTDWTVSSNWTPERTTPQDNDILQINSGGPVTITGFTTQTIGQLLITNNTAVSFTAGSTATMTITGGTGADFFVEAGSQFNVASNTALSISLAAGTTGSILGSVSMAGAGSSTAHRLTGTDASSIIFGSGGSFTSGVNFSGNPFGTANLGSVIFESGATFIYVSGSNPFGASQPNSVLVFQTGSLYKHLSNSSPSMSGRTYSNFELDASGVTLNLTGSSPCVMDNLTVTNGTMNLNITGTSGHSIKGSIYVNTGATLSFTPGSAGTISLNGTSTQTITVLGTFSTGTNSTINLNNAAGLNLASNLTLGGNLTITSGLLKTGANILQVGGTLNVTSPDNTKMIVLDDGTNIGTLKLKTSTTGVNYIFPVGDTRSSAVFTPVTINFASGTNSSSYLDLTMAAVKNSGNSSLINYLNRYWTIEQSGFDGSYEYSITLNYDQNDVVGNESSIFFAKYSGSTWVLLGSPDINNNSFTKTGLTTFSTFTGGEEGVLPVRLASLNSSVEKRNITINWSTSSEANNSGFDVERKGMNESNWMKAGYVQGSGNSNSTKNYSFTDRGLQTGKYQYRLKQIDFNGNYEYFDLNGYVEVGVPNKYDISQNYPNPFNPVTKIDYDLPFDSKVSLRIYDVTGREVKSLFSGDVKAGYYTQLFDASSLSSGIYFYRITANSLSGNFVMTKKMALIK
ncbi:MAG: T9SS type A sorting domain-containing protein [Ignavibacteria bacterium]